jgi:hypothetical protein
LRAVLDATTRDNFTFLTTSFGKPFTAAADQSRLADQAITALGRAEREQDSG